MSDRCNFDEVEVETETEDEEVVDKLVEQRVVKEFKVAQVSARCSYSGEGLTMKKGEVSCLCILSVALVDAYGD